MAQQEDIWNDLLDEFRTVLYKDLNLPKELKYNGIDTERAHKIGKNKHVLLINVL